MDDVIGGLKKNYIIISNANLGKSAPAAGKIAEGFGANWWSGLGLAPLPRQSSARVRSILKMGVRFKVDCL
jgi:hypothetical protein